MLNSISATLMPWSSCTRRTAPFGRAKGSRGLASLRAGKLRWEQPPNGIGEVRNAFPERIEKVNNRSLGPPVVRRLFDDDAQDGIGIKVCKMGEERIRILGL